MYSLNKYVVKSNKKKYWISYKVDNRHMVSSRQKWELESTITTCFKSMIQVVHKTILDK